MLNPSLILAQSALGQAGGTNAPPADAAQAEPGPSAVSGFFDSGALGLLLEGGFFMWPILLLALIGLATLFVAWVLAFVLPIASGLVTWAIVAIGAGLIVANAALEFRRVRGALTSSRGLFGIGTGVSLSLVVGVLLLSSAAREIDEEVTKVHITFLQIFGIALVVSVLLSAQTTDKRVNLVTPELFRRGPTPQKMVKLEVDEILSSIRTCGLAPGLSLIHI